MLALVEVLDDMRPKGSKGAGVKRRLFNLICCRLQKEHTEGLRNAVNALCRHGGGEEV